jgi:hypothetical protein
MKLKLETIQKLEGRATTNAYNTEKQLSITFGKTKTNLKIILAILIHLVV